MTNRPVSSVSHGSPGRVDQAVPSPDAKVYVISVAAELAGMHPQTLRGYDRIGLVRPARSVGGGRRYSWHDIQQLREVSRLTTLGIGLEGVRRILDLQVQVQSLRSQVTELQGELGAAYAAMATTPNLPIPVDSSGHALVVWRRSRRQLNFTDNS
jgi:MerR family transcriptional regulator, heat shock protein HspR